MKKIPSIEAFRFLFICVICLWHCRPISEWLHHGYIAVEFYFMLSGALIYLSYIRHPGIGVLDHSLNKIKRFIIPFWLSIFLLMTLDRKQYFYPDGYTPDAILNKYFVHLHEFFFGQCLGITNIVAINHPMWFLSILIFGGGIIYALLRNFKTKATSLILPLICLFGFHLLLSNGSCAFQNDHDIMGLQTAMIRGLSDMSLGVLVSVTYLRKKDFIAAHTKSLDIVSVLSLFVFSLMLIAHGNFDYLALFVLPVILIACFNERSLFNNFFNFSIWQRLGSMSMYMYIIHLVVAAIFYIFMDRMLQITSPMILLIFYLLIVFFVGYSNKENIIIYLYSFSKINLCGYFDSQQSCLLSNQTRLKSMSVEVKQ